MAGERCRVLIAHHPPPYHLDDYLAVSLLMWKYERQGCEVLRAHVNSLEEAEEEGRRAGADRVIVVDVGRCYIPGGQRLACYDHHQDLNLESSVILVLRHELPELYARAMAIPKIKRLLTYIDFNDRYGPHETTRLLGLDYETSSLMSMIVKMVMTEPSAAVGENFVRFVENYYEAAKAIPVDIPAPVPGGSVRVVIVENPRLPTTVVFSVHKADLAVKVNERNTAHTSIVKNTGRQAGRLLDLSVAERFWPVVFLHPNGFIVVVDASLRDVIARLGEFVRAAAVSGLAKST